MGDDAAKKKEGQKDEDEDDRLEFLLNYLTKSYRLKQEKWNKMIGAEENKVSASKYVYLMWKYLEGDARNNLIKTLLCSRGAAPEI